VGLSGRTRWGLVVELDGTWWDLVGLSETQWDLVRLSETWWDFLVELSDTQCD
jgi:hypothetical protein